MKLKTIVHILEHSNSMGYGSTSSNDTKLRPLPGSMDDVEMWDGITEGKDWFCYVESNNWDKKISGATVYINENDKPHKIWIKIKTHGLRKPTDTNESFIQKIRKHTDKVARSWMTAAKSHFKNTEINEVGNAIPRTWKECFREAMNDPKVKAHLADSGEQEIAPVADPVNFTPRLQENTEKKKIEYSAVVLDKSDQKKLLEQFKKQIPSSWKKYAHHMTINLGALPQSKNRDIGKKVRLTAKKIGVSDKAMALQVEGYSSSNRIPHVTLAVNESHGGKTADSNDIKEWKNLPKTIVLNGTVTELPYE